MDGPTIRVVEDSIYAAGYPRDAEAILLIELDGLEAGVSADLEAVRRICLDGGARNVKVARDDAERLKLWQGRKKAFGAMGRLAPHLIVQDAVIPRTRLPEILGNDSPDQREVRRAWCATSFTPATEISIRTSPTAPTIRPKASAFTRR